MPAASFSFSYEHYKRYGVDPGIKFEDKVNLPAPWHYDAYPLLNAATHATGDARYYPDRRLQRDVSRHTVEPMFLSLPQIEQNRLWQKQLFKQKKQKKQMHEMSHDEAEKVAKGLHKGVTERNILDPDHRVMPFCAHTRMPVGQGIWPHIKHVHSEPGFQIYNPHQGTTRTFEWHRQQHHKHAVKHGLSVLREKLKDKGLRGKDGKLDLVGALKLASDHTVAQRTGLEHVPRKIPHGLGERMVELSFRDFRATNGMPPTSL